MTKTATSKAIELRAGGKKFGEIDQNGGVLTVKKGNQTVSFDLRESARTGKPVILGAK